MLREFRETGPGTVSVGDDGQLRGIAVPYGEWSLPIVDARGRAFRESWDPNAAAWTERTTLVLQHSEARGMPLARVGAGTFRLRHTEAGLSFEADLPASPFGADVRTALERGDLDGSVSVGMIVSAQSWERRTAPALRRVSAAQVFHLAIVAQGAFTGARSTLGGIT